MVSTNGNGPLGANLTYTKFLFLWPRANDDAARARVRAAGNLIARGFFNDFDADGSRDLQPRESIQFLLADDAWGGWADRPIAPFAVHVSANYRPRLDDVEQELRRRLGDEAKVVALDGALRAPRYTSAEMDAFAYKPALARQPGRRASHVSIIPLSKDADWWAKSALERHAYFYPHVDHKSGCPVKGHARAAELGISTIYRRLYHNPDGYQRPGEYDFVTYCEFAPEHRLIFDDVCRSLRDPRQNPEWRFVVEGPEWRGKRTPRW